MTIKKKVFYANTIMVFAALLILLGIGGTLISIFKDEFLTKFSESAEVSKYTTEVKDALLDKKNSNLTMSEWDALLGKYGFGFYAEDSSGKELYKNLRHREWEAVEEINSDEIKPGNVKIFFMEGSTIVISKINKSNCVNTIVAVSTTEEKTFWGMDRGLFEMFIIIFLVVGIIAIAAILLCSQFFTKRLINHILKPLDKLNEATIRIGEGNLDYPINYEKDDEFKPFCDSFDLMQKNLGDSIKKQLEYEKARTEMVSGISHDLRTPLTSIKGYIKGMIDEVANTEEKRQRYLKIAYKKSCDMDALLSKLFYFSKLETGNMPFFNKRTNMNELLNNYVTEKRAELWNKNINIEIINLLDEEIFCDIDNEQTKRVFDNIVENSIKYADTDNLAISIQLQLIIEKPETNQMLLIRFSDNGNGIAEDKIEHVFEQFYRGDESRTSKNDGNGLGLYVCKYIIEEQNGSIDAINSNGFCINIVLPLSNKKTL